MPRCLGTSVVTLRTDHRTQLVKICESKATPRFLDHFFGAERSENIMGRKVTAFIPIEISSF
jgi:hypothetical protein